MFYYDYVPEDQFQEEEAALKGADADAASVNSTTEKSKEDDEKAGFDNDGYESDNL